MSEMGWVMVGFGFFLAFLLGTIVGKWSLAQDIALRQRYRR